jgi:hypothetical protein
MAPAKVHGAQMSNSLTASSLKLLSLVKFLPLTHIDTFRPMDFSLLQAGSTYIHITTLKQLGILG